MTQPQRQMFTFLFTDIEGSTARWERQREAMAAALVRHDALMHAAIERRGGQVFKTVGDAFYAAFDSPAHALRSAIEAQRALAAVDWAAFGSVDAEDSESTRPFEPLRVRMGIHTGRAESRGDDYFGPSLNRTARLTAAAHGGQILLSDASYALVRDGLDEGTSFRDLGQHRLRGLRRSERLWQVVSAEIADVGIPPRTAGELSLGDRIVVSDGRAAPGDSRASVVTDRTVPETFAALRSVITGSAGTVVLTSDQVRAAAQHPPADLTEYRLGRIAEWSQPRYRLDGRFVALTLLVDQGEEAVAGRWQPQQQRFSDLSTLLTTVSEPVAVVLGPPGAGKSTLLRHLELDRALQSLRQPDDETRLTFFLQLNQYQAETPGSAPPAPGEWLATRWAERNPSLPALDTLMREGRITLLLDALNEMPAESEAEFRNRVLWWRDWVVRLARERPGNRVVFSCRTLDYSAPLSTPALRVPQIVIEPLSDDQVRTFLSAYSPVRGTDIWAAIADTPQLEALRAPFFLALLVQQVEATGEVPSDHASLFTGFFRQAIKREVERGAPLFAPSPLLSDRDIRQVVHWRWRSPYELPSRGELVPRIAGLAYRMQADHVSGGARHVRVDFDTALDALDSAHAEDIIRAGTALAALEEDPASDEILFRHQLLQEYFAARKLAQHPEPERVSVAWRSSEVRPGITEVLDTLAAADTLPALPQSGWEETTLLAVAMSDAPEDYVRDLMRTSLTLAGRAAGQATVRPRLSQTLLDDLRRALAELSRDRGADLRARIAAGLTLGPLGDPRFVPRTGPHGDYLLPPLVHIDGGTYPIGDDEPIEEFGKQWSDHIPRHYVELPGFRIGRFPVTNAEWSCFMAAGGYEDVRWWQTPDALAWQRGDATAAGIHARIRWQLEEFRRQPEILEGLGTTGQWPEEGVQRYRERLAMTDAELDTHLRSYYPGGILREPAFWHRESLNNPAQPVVGVSWFEAQAYCAWLAAQTGTAFRLPTEAGHEAAQRGPEGRRWAHGEQFDPLAANTVPTQLKRPSPVGVFVDGDTPEGASDLCGNVSEWTSSRWGTSFGTAEYRYPYVSDDGREDAAAGSDVLCVLRGGCWAHSPANAMAANRLNRAPGSRYDTDGFRLAAPAE